MRTSLEETIDIILSEEKMSLAEAMIRIGPPTSILKYSAQREIIEDLEHAYKREIISSVDSYYKSPS